MDKPAMPLPLRLLFALLLACLAGGAMAQAQTRAYAPENLRTLSVADQTRVISLEYSEQSGGRRIPDDQLRFYLDQVNRSNWGFSRIKSDIAQSLRGGGSPPFNGQTLLCESKDNDARRCTPPWRGTSRLVRQVSNSPCIEGQTWSSQEGLITVWKGCRGEFAARNGAGSGGYSVTCNSVGNRYATCAWNSRYGRPTLLEQLSGTACREGSTWGYSSNRIWVNRGCRARFGVAGQGGSGYSVRCSATAGNLPTWCGWDPQRGRPRVQQEFSARGRCTANTGWGYNSTRRQIWTRNGCSALFVPY